MRSILIILSFVFCAQTYGQTVQAYTYDDAGNRITRFLEVKALNPDDKVDEETAVRATDIESSLGGVKVYPTATFGMVQVDVDNDRFVKLIEDKEKVIITVIDYQGKQLYKEKLREPLHSIDLTNLSIGNYVLHVTSKSLTESWQIIRK